ncbi:hypothetical protein D3C76_1056310 [compost metagenome]
MLLQVRRPDGHPTLLQVGGGRAEYAEHRSQYLGHHLRIRQLAGEGDDDVLAVFQQVGRALGQGQLHHHFGVKLGIARHQRGEVLQTEAGHGVHAQAAVGCEVCAASLGGRLVHLAEDLPAALQVTLAYLGQRQAACGAVQQTGLELLLQFRDQARHLGRGQVHGLGGGGKAAGIYHADEYPHAVERVHCYSPCKADSRNRQIIHDSPANILSLHERRWPRACRSCISRPHSSRAPSRYA